MADIKNKVKHALDERVWFTRAGDIADDCFKLPEATILGS